MKTSQHRFLALNDRAASGVALVAVLSLLSLLTVLALGALSATRHHARLAHVSFAHVQQREIGDSALRLTIMELTAPRAQASSSGVGRRAFSMFGQSVYVEVQREAGRIDLNFADELLLVAAFAGNGYGEDDARRMAARIIDWRDPDDASADQSSERSEYRRAYRGIGPRNGPFEAVTELRLVLGAEQLSEALLDAFTVYSHRMDVRQDAAVPEVTRALQWAQEHQLGGRSWTSQQQTMQASQEERGLAGEVIRMKACSTFDAVEMCRTAVLRLTGDWAYPALIFAWS